VAGPHAMQTSETTGTASPPAVEPEAEDKVEEGARANEEAAAKVGGDDEDDWESEHEGRRGRRQRCRRGGAAGDSAVAMVKRELLTRCLTCPLCDHLLRQATTISECLHTCEPFLLCFACSAAPPIPAGSNACIFTMVPCVLRGFPATAIGFHKRPPRPWGYSVGFGRPGSGDVGRRRRALPFPLAQRRCTAFSSPMRDCDSRRACIRAVL
jgi:hypothetical protein